MDLLRTMALDHVKKVSTVQQIAHVHFGPVWSKMRMCSPAAGPRMLNSLWSWGKVSMHDPAVRLCLQSSLWGWSDLDIHGPVTGLRMSTSSSLEWTGHAQSSNWAIRAQITPVQRELCKHSLTAGSCMLSSPWCQGKLDMHSPVHACLFALRLGAAGLQGLVPA